LLSDSEDDDAPPNKKNLWHYFWYKVKLYPDIFKLTNVILCTQFGRK
jgi:hypothetical protein